MKPRILTPVLFLVVGIMCLIRDSAADSCCGDPTYLFVLHWNVPSAGAPVAQPAQVYINPAQAAGFHPALQFEASPSLTGWTILRIYQRGGPAPLWPGVGYTEIWNRPSSIGCDGYVPAGFRCGIPTNGIYVLQAVRFAAPSGPPLAGLAPNSTAVDSSVMIVSIGTDSGVPTLNHLGLGVLALAVVGAGVVALRMRAGAA